MVRFFISFDFGIFSFLLDEPVTLPSCFFCYTGGTSLVVCIIILHTLLDSIYTLYTVFNDSRERVRSIIKLSMINKLVDANGWWGEYNASWLLWMGKSIGSRHLFNNGRAAHDETERWMDISRTTTSLKKIKKGQNEKKRKMDKEYTFFFNDISIISSLYPLFICC